MSYAKKALKGFIIVFTFNILAAFLGYLYRIYMARNLSVSDYGLFFSLYVFFWFLSYFRDFGIGYSLAKMIPEFEVRKENDNTKTGILTAYIFEFAFTMIIVSIVLLSSNLIAVYYFKLSMTSMLLKLFAVIFIFNMFSSLSKFILQGYQETISYSLIYFLENLFILLSIMTFFYFEKSITYATYSFIVAYFLLFIISTIIVFKGRNIVRHEKIFSEKILKRFLVYGIPLFIGGLASLIYLYTDTLILAYFRTSEEVGLYSVAVSSSMILNFIGVSIGTVLLPLISEAVARKENENLKKGVSLAYKYLFFIVLPPVIIMFAFSNFFINLLFGENYIPAYISLQILALGVLFLVISTVANQIILAFNKTGLATKITISTAILNLLLNLIFIPKYGTIAAAYSTLISYLVLCTLSVYYAAKLLVQNPPYMIWFKTFISGLIFLIILYFIKEYFAFLGLTGVIISVIISGVFYILVNLGLKSITFDDFRFVMRNLLQK